jgi:chaperonin cofactor prefoldin
VVEEDIQCIKKGGIMMLLFLISFGSFEWKELKNTDPKEITYQIKQEIEENVSRSRKVINSLVYLDDKVFKEGGTLLVPHGFKIKEVPSQMELKKLYVKMAKYDRYAVVIGEGRIESKWKKLKDEFKSALGDNSIESLLKDIDENTGIKRTIGSFPEETYFSFILIEKEGEEKLIPVILNLSPLRSIIEGVKEGEE